MYLTALIIDCAIARLYRHNGATHFTIPYILNNQKTRASNSASTRCRAGGGMERSSDRFGVKLYPLLVTIVHHKNIKVDL